MLNTVEEKIAACHKYAKENVNVEGTAVMLECDGDFDEQCEWAKAWLEDGVPVAKMFERNQAAPCYMSNGSTTYGVHYIGRHSGKLILEFIVGKTWFRTYLQNEADERFVFTEL